MWWCRRAAARLLVAAFAVGAAGCGFRPLHGGVAGERVTAALGAIEVLPIDGPLGVEMRNRLLDLLVPAGAAPRYELAVRIAISAYGQVTEKNTQIRRYLLRLDADYVLRAKADGRELAAGRVSTETSYNIVSGEDYSTLVAERNAAGEAARDAGREIALRLALWFDRQGAE